MATTPSLLFSWSQVTTDTSGNTVNDPTAIVYRLYEDGQMIVDNIGEIEFSLLMTGKEHKAYSYYVTALDNTTKLESVPSNSVSVNFTLPAAPAGLSVKYFA